MKTGSQTNSTNVSLSESIKFLMDHHPEQINSLKYGEIKMIVRDGKIKVLQVLHSIDVEKLGHEQEDSDGNVQTKQG
jgi:hypothetical protein